MALLNGVGDLSLTGGLTTSGAAVIGGATTISTKKLVLYDGVGNANQFYGFGVNAGMLTSQIESTSNQFAWYAATSASASNQVMTLSGTGNLSVKGGTLDVYSTG